jgi:allantoinase
LQHDTDPFTLFPYRAIGGRATSIALHPFLIGVPHRIRYLEKALQYIASHGKIWFATSHEIIRAYREQEE